MKRIVHFTLMFFVLGLLFSCAKGYKPAKPNVLIILADDLGYSDLSCMGSNYYETPNIDRIAESGMVFTNGYANCQVCSPSRASILTGQFPARHGITNWIGELSGTDWRQMNRYSKLLPAEYKHQLDSALTTLPEVLKQAGYTTFFAGKWHLGGKGSWPEDHGFDINMGGWDSGGPKGGYFSPYKNPNLIDGPEGENLEMRLASETVKFIKENREKPFLAYLSFYAVHGPIQTTKAKWAKYRNKAERQGIADTGFKMAKHLPCRLYQDNPVYAGLVESMDDAVGKVIGSLQQLGLDKNTIVIFTSDNGGVTSGDSFSTSNAPLRGGKGYQWEGGIREPFFVSVPWMDLDGKKSDVPVTGADIFPTILDLLGLNLMPEKHMDGQSFLPVLNSNGLQERALIWHYPHYGNQGGDPSSIIRKGDWKLIHYYEDGHEELYNLKEDLSETTDLATSHPELAEKLHTELFEYLNQVGANFPEPDSLYNEAKDAEYHQMIINERLPLLEQQRKKMLSPEFDPGNNWWGSVVTND